MFTIKKVSISLMACWLTVVGSSAWALNPMVEEILVKSGAVEQLAYIAQTAQVSYENASRDQDPGEQPSATLRARIKRLIGEAFEANRLKDAIGRELEAKLTTSEMEAILLWLDTPLVKKCTQLEIEASTPEASKAIEAYAVQLKRTPAPKSRMQLAKRFDTAQQATRSTATVILGMQLASMSAMIALLPPEHQVPFADLVKAAEKQRPSLEVSMRPLVRAQILYTYRSLSNAELERYIREIETGPGKKFYSVSQSAYEKALVEASARTSRSIVETMRNLNKETDA